MAPARPAQRDDQGPRAGGERRASTGTKNPTYSDVLYVEQLIAADVVNTMPEATLRAFADHGDVNHRLIADAHESDEALGRLAAAGIDLPALTAGLEREGVRSFCDSYHQLLACIETKVAQSAVAGHHGAIGT